MNNRFKIHMCVNIKKWLSITTKEFSFPACGNSEHGRLDGGGGGRSRLPLPGFQNWRILPSILMLLGGLEKGEFMGIGRMD